MESKLPIGVIHSLRIAKSTLAVHLSCSADKTQLEVEGLGVKSEKGYSRKSEEILRRDTFANLPNVFCVLRQVLCGMLHVQMSHFGQQIFVCCLHISSFKHWEMLYKIFDIEI